jgi:hypothetical protein
MKYHYPETSKGEYYKLTKSRYTGKKVTIGTIVKMIRDAGGKILQKRVVKEIEYQDRLNEIKMLTEILQRKKNGTK